MKHAHLNFFLIPTLLLGVSTVAAAPEPETRLSPDAAVAAASELAELLHDNYVFPEIGVRYAEALEARIEQGHYSSGMSPDELANDLETLVNQVHRDAHLRVRVSGAERGGQRRMRRGPGTGGAIGTTTWIDGDVAFIFPISIFYIQANIIISVITQVFKISIFYEKTASIKISFN